MWGWIEKCWGGVCVCTCTAPPCSHHQGNVAFDFPGRLMWPQGNFSPSLPSLLQKLCQLWEPLFYESEPVWEAFLMGELDLEMWKTLPSTCPSVSYRVSLCSDLLRDHGQSHLISVCFCFHTLGVTKPTWVKHATVCGWKVLSIIKTCSHGTCALAGQRRGCHGISPFKFAVSGGWVPLNEVRAFPVACPLAICTPKLLHRKLPPS